MEEKDLFKVLAVTLVIVVLLFVYSLSLGRIAENFTEVWLTENPKEVKSGEEFQAKFVISNKEGKELDYNYKIIFDKNEKIGKVKLKDGEKKEIEEKISLNEKGKQKVLIEVSNEVKPDAYSVWFWVSVK